MDQDTLRSLCEYWEMKHPESRRTFETQNASDTEAEIKPPPSPSLNHEVTLSSLLKNSPSLRPSIAVGQTPAPDDLGYIPSSQTELETSLPAIKVDEDAIEKYEASKHEAELGLHGRLRDGVWQRGKSSIYVDAFNLALETVLGEESHLFNEAEMEIFTQWRGLSYESQYLYVLTVLVICD
jgi:Fanconi-associated nuclease 1